MLRLVYNSSLRCFKIDNWQECPIVKFGILEFSGFHRKIFKSNRKNFAEVDVAALLNKIAVLTMHAL